MKFKYIKKKKLINKIAILINWTRELDFYEKIIEKFDTNQISLIVNDIKTNEIERKNNTLSIIESLKRKKKDFYLFSEVYKNLKFNVIISTGLSCPKKITFYSVVKFFYAQSFGSFLNLLRLSKYLNKFLKKDITGGGQKTSYYEEWFPEKKLGETTIFFPRGFDLRLKHFPNKKFKNVFDIFLCYGEFDKQLIQQKFNNKNNFIIGYPKYDISVDLDETKKKIYREFDLDPQKKIIFWCPTYIEEKNEISENIKIWLRKISNLKKHFNIIIRPHPKNIVVDQDLKKTILNEGLYLDGLTDRKLIELYSSADLILLDYGASVMTSIYLEKNMALLELPSNFKFIEKLEKNKSLDSEIRREISKKNILSLDNNSLLAPINDLIVQSNLSNILLLKKKYFGNNKNSNLNFLVDKLKKKLKYD